MAGSTGPNRDPVESATAGGQGADGSSGLARATTRLFVRMVREEYRLHAELFGRRFATFPAVVALLSGVGFWLVGLTDTSTDAIAAGVHALVFFLGLQVGTIGLVGRDALRDVLGDVTLLVFSARTLPVTWRRLLATFLLKDLAYYSAFFLAPLSVGYAVVALAGGASAASVLALWVTTTGTFGLGVGASLTLIGLALRSRLLVLAAVAAVAGAVWSGFAVASLTPYAAFREPGVATAVTGFAPAVVLGVVGPLLYRPAESTAARTAGELYPRVRAVLGRDRPVATRTLLEVARSGGSVWKVLFSMGLLFGVTALLVREVGEATALDPSPGIAFGTLLGLGAFTTYSWVSQFDDEAEYLRYPLPTATVFDGKRLAYLLLTVPAGLVYLGASLAWFPLADVAIGVVVFPLVAVYVFGVTAYLTGLSPNELLFDTPLFAAFGVAVAAVAVPLVTAALAHDAAPTAATAVSLSVSAVAAVFGWWLAGRAGPRWGRRVRSRR